MSSNLTANNYTRGNVMSPVFVHLFTLWYLFIGVIGAFSNVCVLVAFFNVVKLRSKVNYFLVSLAFSDLIFQCTILPIELEWHIRTVFIHSVAVCEFIYTMHFLTISCSCLNLLAVSGYRYMTICHPFASKRITKKQVISGVFIIWLYSVLTALLPIMGWRNVPSSVDGQLCFYSYKPEFSLFIIGANWFFPAFMVFILYGLIFRIARIQAAKIAKNQVVLEQTDRKKRGYLLKGAISLAKIFAAYIVCWLPYIINAFISQLPNIPYEAISMRQEYHYSILLLGYSNTAINPFLYAGLCEDFNIVFKRYFHRFSHSLRSMFSSAGHTLRASVRRRRANGQQRSSHVRYISREMGSSTYQQAVTILSSTV